MILETAKLDWRDGQPVNEQFQDIYFSADGDQEVARVFLAPSDFQERTQTENQLTVAEFGFGSGRNFLNAASVALANGCRLHFISVEAHPIADGELLRALEPTEHRDLALELSCHYPPPIAGWHRRTFANGRLVLSLYFGDVHDFLHELEERHPHGVDAWFLDGFAPDRNPDMWDESLLRRLGKISRLKATVATFTAAGRVRRALESAGFQMRRVDQRPHKRESLAGRLNAGAGRKPSAPPGHVHVVGAGIAGCSLATHLADAGIDVLLTDTASGPATGASSVVAMQHARLLGDGSPMAEWRAASYQYATHWNWHRQSVRRLGALQGTGPNMDEAKLKRIVRAYEGSGSWLQLHEDTHLWFPEAGVVDLAKLCHELIDHERIECRFNTDLGTELPTIYACGAQTPELSCFENLPIRPVWGQIDIVKPRSFSDHAEIGNGYLAPAEEGLIVGSTYEYAPWAADEATAKNLERLQGSDYRWLCRRRGVRAVPSDRTPLVGRYNGRWISAGHGSMGATSAYLSAAVITHMMMGWIPPIAASVERLLDPHRFEKRLSRRSNGR